ncbi:MAG: DegV family protein [Dehalococcoidia bacterium]|nr:DegV family protein [Dehalococcoidia bacterium]
MPVRIVTDSTADLSPELVKTLNITVVPVYVRFGQTSYRDGIDINRDEFYDKLVNSRVHPTTSQPTPADFARVYLEVAKDTDEIVSVHVSGKLSGTYNSALRGKELAAEKCDIQVMDSQSVSMGLGLVTLAAARLAAAGQSLHKVIGEVDEAIANTHLLGVFDTLKYLLLGGRIGKAKALIGSLLNVKPVLSMRDGEFQPVGNVRTRARGIERLIEFARSMPGIHELAVIHSTTQEEAHRLKERLGSLVDSSHLHLARLGPALGVHGGPGVLAVAVRKKVGAASSGEEEAEPVGHKINVPSLHLPKIKPRS